MQRSQNCWHAHYVRLWKQRAARLEYARHGAWVGESCKFHYALPRKLLPCWRSRLSLANGHQVQNHFYFTRGQNWSINNAWAIYFEEGMSLSSSWKWNCLSFPHWVYCFFTLGRWSRLWLDWAGQLPREKMPPCWRHRHYPQSSSQRQLSRRNCMEHRLQSPWHLVLRRPQRERDAYQSTLLANEL